ncbi:DUF4259 domain-containing protein [Streptomyces lavendulae]|uniref:DUF4259 domain-containing protein n=1 Tax=Streptomyces lavendulae TaxID=1914 RepID=UPI0037140614
MLAPPSSDGGSSAWKTWETGPFDSDMAADFVDGLAGMSSEQVIEALREPSRRWGTPASVWMLGMEPKPLPLSAY